MPVGVDLVSAYEPHGQRLVVPNAQHAARRLWNNRPRAPRMSPSTALTICAERQMSGRQVCQPSVRLAPNMHVSALSTSAPLAARKMVPQRGYVQSGPSKQMGKRCKRLAGA